MTKERLQSRQLRSTLTLIISALGMLALVLILVGLQPVLGLAAATMPENKAEALSAALAPEGEATLGDFVWHDIDLDTFLNGLEAGIDGVLVELYEDDGDYQFDPGDTLIGQAITGDDASTINIAEQGWYDFGIPATPAVYWVVINPGNFASGQPLAGMVLTTENAIGPTPLLVIFDGNNLDYNDADFGLATASVDLVKVAGSAANDATEYLPAPGATMYYTYTVTNTGEAYLSNTVVTDDNGTPGVPGDDVTVCTIAGPLAPLASQQCYWNTPAPLAADHTNWATAVGNPTDSVSTDLAGDPNGDDVSASDDAVVSITSITVTKTANPTTLDEPGGLVNFAVSVNNTSSISGVTINSLTDSIHGDLNGQGNCTTPQIIPAGGFYTCVFTATVSGNAGDTETNVVTVVGTDDDASPVSGSDDATVTMRDLPSSIVVTKSANPTELPEPGGTVTFTLRVDNTSTADTITITSILDSIYGNLNGLGNCSVPRVIPAGGYYQCTFSAFVSGVSGDTEVDVISVVSFDDDDVLGNVVSYSDFVVVSIVDSEPVPGCVFGHKVDDLHIGLPGWIIRTRPAAGGGPEYQTITDATGFFVFPNLTPGRWLMWEVQQAGWVPVTSEIFEVTVPPGPGCIQVRFKNRQATSTPTPVPTWTPTPTPTVTPELTCPCSADQYEPDDLLGAAKLLPMDGATQTHTFHAATDVDWFRMDGLSVSAKYNVRTTDLAPGTDTFVTLYDNLGNFVANNDDIDATLCMTDPQACASSISWIATNSGPYYLIVRTLTYPQSQYPACYCPGYSIRGRTPGAYLPIIVVPAPVQTTPTPTPTATPIPPSGLMHPKDVAVNPSAHRAYITSRDNDRLYMLDTSSLAFIKSVKTGDEPWGVAYDPNTNRVYVSNFQSSDLYVYNATTLDLITVISTDGHPTYVALDTTRNLIAVVNRTINGVIIMDGNTDEVKHIKASGGVGPWDLVFNTNLNRLYVSNRDIGGVATLDGAKSFEEISSQAVQPCGDRSSPYNLAFNPLNDKLYVSCAPAGYVNRAVIYQATASGLIRLASLETGDGGRDGGGGIAINPATGNVFYTNAVDNTVTVISGATNSVIGTVPVGNSPFGAAADPVTHRVFVVNRDSNNYSVIAD